MSEDILHEQISNRAASPTLEAKGLSSKADSLLGVTVQWKAGEDITCCTLELTGIWKLPEASDFPIFFPAWHGEL